MNNAQILEQLILDLVSRIGCNATCEIDQSEEGILINLRTPDSALLIGQGGQNLLALQHLLRVLANDALPEVNLWLDIESYHRKKTDALKELAMRTAEKVRTAGQIEILRPMRPFERRVVHMVISAVPDLETESRGEEPYRRVVIKPKKIS